MSKTSNIGLNLTEDDSTKFSDWRKSIDGNGTGSGKSNMQIIDEVIGCQTEQLNALVGLLVDILKACIYTSDQTDNLNELKAVLFGDGSAGGNTSSGVVQTGSKLKIYSDVTASQNGSTLLIA